MDLHLTVSHFVMLTLCMTGVGSLLYLLYNLLLLLSTPL